MVGLLVTIIAVTQTSRDHPCRCCSFHSSRNPCLSSITHADALIRPGIRPFLGSLFFKAAVLLNVLKVGMYYTDLRDFNEIFVLSQETGIM